MNNYQHYACMETAWEELRIHRRGSGADVVQFVEASSIEAIFLDEDGVLVFDYNNEQELISAFVEAYNVADKTSK